MTNAFDDVEGNLDAPAVAPPKMKKAKTKPEVASVAKSDKIKIILEENDDIPPTGLFVGLNGMGYLIRPGVEVEVPPGVAEILQNAITSMPTLDPTSGQVVGYRERMRYPFRRV